MAWNPSPEVAVARDSARRLGNARQAIVLWITDDEQIGMASYGRTKALCAEAGRLGRDVFEAAKDHISALW